MKYRYLYLTLICILTSCSSPENNTSSYSSNIDNFSSVYEDSIFSSDNTIDSSFVSEDKESSSVKDESSSFLESITTSQPEIDNYYKSISDSMSGSNLQNALYNIIKGHTKIAYNGLEQAMLYTDRNWDISPDENDENPVMDLLYYTKNDDPTNWQTWDKYHSSKNPFTPEKDQIWDKEHIWAKSNGFPSEGAMPYSDLHHLRASDMKNNNARSNFPLAEVETVKKNIQDCSNTNSGKTGIINGVTVYEPLDEDKGDVARALLYMATRYGNESFKLTLTKGNDSSGGKWGFLDTLLKWNREDLPDEFEKRRNDIIYEKYQHNRNPFIDHPEYADRIYNA